MYDRTGPTLSALSKLVAVKIKENTDIKQIIPLLN